MRHLLPLALLVLVPVLLAPAGSAKPPPVTKFEICVQNATGGTATPDCSATGTPSVFAGNSVATVQLSVINDSTSTSQVGSATLTVPPQLKVVANTAAPTKYVSSSGQTISFHDLNLPAGKSFTATFSVDVACGGKADWSGQSQQAFASSDGTGTSFGYQGDAKSSGAPSNITTACHLAFTNQPTDTQTGQIIRDGGASAGDPTGIHVGLLDQDNQAMTSCPVGYATCSVSIDSDPTGVNAQSQSLDSNGFVTSFANLSISIPSTDVADQFNLVASPTEGSFAPPVTSSSFLVAQSVTGLACPGNSCSTGSGHQTLSGANANLADSFVDVSSSNGFTFMTLSPYTLVGSDHARAGCQGLTPLGVTGFAESDNRLAGSGTLTIKYYVNKDILTARYGQNYGNQFAPMCVGARPVDTTTGAIHDCNEQGPWNTGGWLGDIIVNGKFKTGSVPAVCDSDGYYWGIISSYQDKLDATKNPVVTSWGGQNIGGANYREFDMSIPPNWDWRSGP